MLGYEEIYRTGLANSISAFHLSKLGVTSRILTVAVILFSFDRLRIDVLNDNDE